MTPAQAVTRAVAWALAQRTARATADVTLSVVQGKAVTDVRGLGAATMDLHSGAAELTIAYHGTCPQTVDELVLGSGTWLEVVGANGVTGGRSWVRLPANSGPSRSPAWLGSLVSPSMMLSELRAGHGSVRPLGSEVFGGARLTGYQTTPSAPSTSGSHTAPGPETNAAAVPTIGLWVDSAGRLARMSLVQRSATATATETEIVDVVLAFTRFGAAVHLRTPDPGSVMSPAKFDQVVAMASRACPAASAGGPTNP